MHIVFPMHTLGLKRLGLVGPDDGDVTICAIPKNSQHDVALHR